MNPLLILTLIFGTLVAVTVFAVVAKKYGVQFLTAAMAVAILLTNVMNVKFIDVFGYAAPAGVLIFAMTFVISDMLSEFWGKQEAQKAVWAGFLGSLLYLFILQITIVWPPAVFSIEASQSFAALYGLLPRIVFGSMIAYIVVQNFDVWFYHKIKAHTKDKHLWFRNNLSTVTSQLLDSIVFFSIAFLGTTAFPNLQSLVIPIITIWVIKSVIAVIDTPFIYFLRAIVKKIDAKV